MGPCVHRESHEQHFLVISGLLASAVAGAEYGLG